MGPDGRKARRHFDLPGHAHLTTFSCYRRLPLLTNGLWRGWLSSSLNRAAAHHAYGLIGFVFMPEHVHMLVLPRRPTYAIATLLAAIKRPVSFRVGAVLRARGSPLLARLTVRERPGVICFRFWQEGAGHDRNLTTPEALELAPDYIHLSIPSQWARGASCAVALVELTARSRPGDVGE